MITLSYVALWKRPVADSVLLATQSLLSADLQGAVRTLPVGTAHVRNWAAGGPCHEVTVCSRIAYTDGVIERTWKFGPLGQRPLHIGRADLPGRLPWTATILISHLQCAGILQCYIQWASAFGFVCVGPAQNVNCLNGNLLKCLKGLELCLLLASERGIIPRKSATLLVKLFIRLSTPWKFIQGQ